MRYLLDTHAFLWLVLDDPQLPSRIFELLDNSENTVCVSIVSIWELGIKINAEKMELSPSLDELVSQAIDNDMQLLAVRPEHIYTMMRLPLYHRDPFDRMIIAQSIADEMVLISKDRAFLPYSVNRIWE